MAGHHPAKDSLQAVALGPREVHVAAQGTVEVLQGFLCHPHLPLGHEDVLARETAWSAGRGGAVGEGLLWPSGGPALLGLHQTQPALRSGSCPQATPSIPGSILLLLLLPRLLPRSSHWPALLRHRTTSNCPLQFLSTLLHTPSFQNCRQGTLMPMEGQSAAESRSNNQNPAPAHQAWGTKAGPSLEKGLYVQDRSQGWVAP